jgi:hypothetical protein
VRAQPGNTELTKILSTPNSFACVLPSATTAARIEFEKIKFGIGFFTEAEQI